MLQDFQLREVFNAHSVTKLADRIALAWPQFDRTGFATKVTSQLATRSLGERSNLIRDTLAEFLPDHFPDAVQILVNALEPEMDHCNPAELEAFIIVPQCDFVARYGLEYFDISMNALSEMTRRFSAEGAIRAFIEHYPERALAQLAIWAEDDNCHVRRLVSEGTRPRLPLAPRLHQFVKDPGPVLQLLEKLKTDPELLVRRSVANNLNDIAKDHPDLVAKTLREWKRIDDAGTQWLIKHAARTLIKQGHKDTLALFGFTQDHDIDVSNLQLDAKNVAIGDTLAFSFEIQSETQKPSPLMIDYVIHHHKANGKLKPKVFKLSKRVIKPGETLLINRKHSFRRINTRVYYPGSHRLEIQVNGMIKAGIDFELS